MNEPMNEPVTTALPEQPTEVHAGKHAAPAGTHSALHSPKKSAKDRIWLVSLLVCIAVFLFSAWQLFSYWREGQTSDNYVSDLADQTVTVKPTQKPSSDAALPQKETAPIEVDFAALQAQNSDVVAWLYCADTPINYPVARADDNAKYLHTLLDGTHNQNGTLFMDFRNAADYSDRNTIIYGHNMKSGKMFGTLDQYKKQEYYDQHPVWYLLTPQGAYKVELAAGWVTQDTDPLYNQPADEENITALLKAADRRSTFASGITLTAEDEIITFSTCSYENETARYVLVGRMIPLDAE